MRLGRIVVLSLVGLGCEPNDAFVGQTDEPPALPAEQRVVGGRSETGYPSVGYLMVGSPLNGPHCGATVINARAAVTAAHCIYDQQAAGMGFGAAQSAQEHAGTRFLVHPQYRPS